MVRIILQPAYVLHSRAYRDSSLLLSVLTLQYGVLTLLAKGVKQRLNVRSWLSPFMPLLISWSGKGELPILGKIEPNGVNYNLSGLSLLSGLYLNELLIKLLPQHDPCRSVYVLYEETLRNLKPQALSQTLRIFEKHLLITLGYGLQLDKEATGDKIEPEFFYYFKSGVGFIKTEKQIGSFALFSGKSLLALHYENMDMHALKDAKILLQSILQGILGNKSINAKKFFKDCKIIESAQTYF